MTRHSNSGIVFGLQLADAIALTPVRTDPSSRFTSRWLRVGVAAIGVTVLMLLAASPALAISYLPNVLREYERTEGISAIGIPAINDSGTIAVAITRDGGGQEVRMYNAPQSPTIFAETFNSIDFVDLSINNNNTIVFDGRPTSTSAFGIWTVRGGFVSLVVEEAGGSSTTDGIEISGLFLEDWDLTDNDVVAFHGILRRPGNVTHAIISRNLASTDFTKRTTEANPSEFRFHHPAANGQGNLAVWLDIGSGGSTSGITRQQIISDFGTIMDTSGQFDVVPSPFQSVFERIDMGSRNDVAFLANLDTGFEAIFTFDRNGTLTKVVDTSGPFATLRNPSINFDGKTAFLATFDVGQGMGIFKGPDPLNDKVIELGDFLFRRGGVDRVVTRVAFGQDGLSRNGRMAFKVQDQLGVEYLFRAGPGIVTDLDLDSLLQLTTAMVSSKRMTQSGLTPPPGVEDPMDLTFDYRLMTQDATLIAKINDTEVGRVDLARATQPMEEFATNVIRINPTAIFGSIFPDEFSLTFDLVGGPGQTVQLDNISLANVALVNGDFATRDLTGWQFDDGGGAAMVTNGLDLVFVPEPSAIVLFGLGAIGTLVIRRRNRPSF